jgi:zinc protease
MRRLLLAIPVLLLAACPMLGTLPPPAEAPRLGVHTDLGPASPPGAFDDEPTKNVASGNAAAGLLAKPVPADFRKLPVAPLVWNAPLISSFADTLAPGVVVYWVPDSSLPLASAQFVWPEGRLALDRRQDAAASLLSDFLREGGAGALSSTRLDDTLEFLAARAGVSIGMVRTSAAVSGLSRDLPFLLDVLTDMITVPRFDTARLSTLKSERLQNLEHAFDTPAQCLDLTWDRIAYGSNTWTRLADSLDVRKLAVADFRKALQGRFDPSHVLIGVAGSYDKPRVRDQLKSMLGRIAAARKGAVVAKLDSIAPVGHPDAPGVWIHDVPATQSNIRIGTRFVQRDHPDYYPLMLASEVLGQSGFGSRLVDRVRSDEGLAYFVRSFVGSDYDRPAMIGVGLQTKVASTGRAIQIVLEEIRHLADSGFRAGELDKARKGLAASVPSLFDTPEGTADMIVQSAAWKRHDAHFQRYLRALDTIPETEILRVYRKWFVPESLRIAIAGPADELRKPFADGSRPLATYGPVRVWTVDSLRKD